MIGIKFELYETVINEESIHAAGRFWKNWGKRILQMRIVPMCGLSAKWYLLEQRTYQPLVLQLFLTKWERNT